MQSVIKFNEGTKFSLCFINIFNKYVWVVPLKDKNGMTIANEFQKISNYSMRKPNKIWLDKGSEFCK